MIRRFNNIARSAMCCWPKESDVISVDSPESTEAATCTAVYSAISCEDQLSKKEHDSNNQLNEDVDQITCSSMTVSSSSSSANGDESSCGQRLQPQHDGDKAQPSLESLSRQVGLDDQEVLLVILDPLDISDLDVGGFDSEVSSEVDSAVEGADAVVETETTSEITREEIIQKEAFLKIDTTIEVDELVSEDEVVTWVTKHKLPLVVLDRMREFHLYDLNIIQEAGPSALDNVTSGMTIIEKKKLLKAIKELKPVPDSPIEVVPIELPSESVAIVEEGEKEELCAWLIQYKLSVTIYDRLKESNLDSLMTLKESGSEILDSITVGMTVIEKKKFLKAVKELKNPLVDSTSSADSSTLIQVEEEVHEPYRNPLCEAEESASCNRLQKAIDDEFEAINNIITVMSRGTTSFTEEAKEKLIRSRENHQDRARRLMALLQEKKSRSEVDNSNDDGELISMKSKSSKGYRVRFAFENVSTLSTAHQTSIWSSFGGSWFGSTSNEPIQRTCISCQAHFHSLVDTLCMDCS